jgi:hypothetical protein
MKRSSLQNRVSKFAPKKFYEIDPRFEMAKKLPKTAKAKSHNHEIFFNRARVKKIL